MIGMILRNMRKTAKLSQNTLGKKLSMADTTISSYERENSQADFQTISNIAEICGYTIIFKDRDGNILTTEEMSKEKDY
ncbi:MAG: helix-turn-helix transcriptional regulator [Clostridia bacterium]|nr:helix-turn-helix transcriptional regulator [Clostridia bacterium]